MFCFGKEHIQEVETYSNNNGENMSRQGRLLSLFTIVSFPDDECTSNQVIGSNPEVKSKGNKIIFFLAKSVRIVTIR